jgi:hypothetical protein
MTPTRRRCMSSATRGGMTRSGSMSQALAHSRPSKRRCTAAEPVAALDFEVRDRPRDAIPHLGARQLDRTAVLEAGSG